MVPNHPLKTDLKTSLIDHSDTLGFFGQKTEKTQCWRGLQATYMPVGWSRGRVGRALRAHFAQLGQELRHGLLRFFHNSGSLRLTQRVLNNHFIRPNSVVVIQVLRCFCSYVGDIL